MNDIIIHIPFSSNDKDGTVEVCYKENKSASESGFDLLKGLGFDIEKCIGYPTMHAYIKNFNGTGYSCSSAWIQIITDNYFSSLNDELPSKVISEADISNNMRKLGVPFFAFGYPSEIYDAPCNNLGYHARLEWIADTFLVTQPNRINNNTISYLIGFRWGYEEWDVDGKRNIRILPIEVIDRSTWNAHLPLLKEDFPNWHFE
jgi:hypothetical protein